MDLTPYLPVLIGIAVAGLLAGLGYAARAVIARHWRVVLPRTPLPTLALAASYGVYSYALLFVPWWVAVVQAAAFELTYIGLAAAHDLDGGQRKRAAGISVGAVATSVIYNTLAGWFHRQPQLLETAHPGAWLALATLHGAPLAWVAYLVAQLLLHERPRGQAQIRKQRRALIRRLARELRTTRDKLAQTTEAPARELAELRAQLDDAVFLGAQRLRELQQLAPLQESAAQQARDTERAQAELAQARASLARSEQAAAQHEREAAQAHARVAEIERIAAQHERELAQARTELAQVGEIDLRAVAQALARSDLGAREIGRLLGRNDSTVRGWLKISQPAA